MENQIKFIRAKGENNYIYETQTLNGLRHGPQRWFDSNGLLATFFHCKNDQVHGIDCNYWSQDETIKNINQIKYSNFHGLQIHFKYA